MLIILIADYSKFFCFTSIQTQCSDITDPFTRIGSSQAGNMKRIDKADNKWFSFSVHIYNLLKAGKKCKRPVIHKMGVPLFTLSLDPLL